MITLLHLSGFTSTLYEGKNSTDNGPLSNEPEHHAWCCVAALGRTPTQLCHSILVPPLESW